MSEGLLFYPGIHQPADCKHLERSFVSVNRLKTRKSDFVVADWIMDSGAFTELNKKGYFELTPEAYADHIVRWNRCGNLIAACTQDYMCEPFMFEGQDFGVMGKPYEKLSLSAKKMRDHLEYMVSEGADPMWFNDYFGPIEDWWKPVTVTDHQQETVDRYVRILRALRARRSSAYLMPVLQGYLPDEYVECLRMYEERRLLPHGSYVGVGSVCKRNVNPETVVGVLAAIKRHRPDLRLHGFGIKITALRDHNVRALLHSADSMAWSVDARHTRNRIRKQGGDWQSAPSPNDWRVAVAYAGRVQEIINGTES